MDTFTRFEHIEETLEFDPDWWQLEQENDEEWLDLFRPDTISADVQKDLDLAKRYGV
ncbi:MAG: hypothetical protein WDA42_03640 [Candidatus Bathyarchaeia archaeon]